jgi:hypothetical protein
VTLDDALRSNFTRRIRDVDEIQIEPEKYRLQRISQLGELEFGPVTDHSSGRLVVNALLSIDLLDEMLWDLGEDEAFVDDLDFRVLEATRRRLLSVMISSDQRIFREMHEFTWHDHFYQMRYETLAFDGYLKLLRMQILNRSALGRLTALEFNQCRACQELEAEDIIPEELRQQRPLEINCADLRACFIQLEIRSRELKLVYDNRLGGCTPDALLFYADLLLQGASRITQQTHPELVFLGSGDAYIKLANGQCKAHERFSEDLLWVMIPFVRELYRQKKAFPRVGQCIPFSKADAQLMDTYFADYAEQKALLAPRESMRKLYPKLAIQPSEPRRFARTEKLAVMDDWGIINACRGQDRKGAIMDTLSKSPWIFLRQKLQPRNIRDALLLLIIDAYVNNRSSINFLSNFVVFHSHLETEELPGKFLADKRRPLIVQSYNHFNLYYNGELFVYNKAMLAFLHWLRILLRPPFNGIFNGVDIRPILNHLPLASLSIPLRD